MYFVVLNKFAMHFYKILSLIHKIYHQNDKNATDLIFLGTRI